MCYPSVTPPNPVTTEQQQQLTCLLTTLPTVPITYALGFTNNWMWQTSSQCCNTTPRRGNGYSGPPADCSTYPNAYNISLHGVLIPKAARRWSRHPSLRLTSGNDPHRAAINHFSYDEAHTYLGDSLTPNLQMRTGDTALMQRGLTFSRRLVSSSLSRHDVWITYFAVFQPAMTYTFPVSLTIRQPGSTRYSQLQPDPR
jgi:hypothetical protein